MRVLLPERPLSVLTQDPEESPHSLMGIGPLTLYFLGVTDVKQKSKTLMYVGIRPYMCVYVFMYVCVRIHVCMYTCTCVRDTYDYDGVSMSVFVSLISFVFIFMFRLV